MFLVDNFNINLVFKFNILYKCITWRINFNRLKLNVLNMQLKKSIKKTT